MVSKRTCHLPQATIGKEPHIAHRKSHIMNRASRIACSHVTSRVHPSHTPGGRDGDEEAATRGQPASRRTGTGRHDCKEAGNGGGRVGSGGAEGVGDQHARSTGQGRGSSVTDL